MSALEARSAESAATLLSQLLADTPRAGRLLELGRGRISLGFVTAYLRARGVTARPVRARGHELDRLATPTLVSLSSGELLVLSHVEGGWAELERGDGQRERLRVAALAERVELALERNTSLSLERSLGFGLLGALAEHAASLFWLGLVILGLALLGVLLPWLTRQAMGPALSEHAPSLLGTAAIGMLAAASTAAWLAWLRSRTELMLSADLARAAAQAMTRRLLALSYAEHQSRGVGQLLQAWASAQAVARGATALGVGPSFDALSGLVFLVALAIEAAPIALALGGWTLLAWLGAFALSRRYAGLQSSELERAARSRARLHEIIQGIATLKAGRAEARGLLGWLEALVVERGFGLRRELVGGALEAWLLGFERVGKLVLLGFTASEVLSGELAVADLVYLGMLGGGFLHAAAALCRVQAPLFAARSHLSRVDDLTRLERSPEAPPFSAAAPHGAEHAIEMRDVWFRYGPEEPWILRGYDLQVRAGDHFVLGGPSGMGKTSILRLVAGLYRPERGTVAVFGRDPWVQRAGVLYLPQHAQLFSGSLKDNLMNLSGADLQAVIAASQQTGLAELLASLPMGLETIVAPGGSNLSGGQRQWVVLTAAVASARPLVLLDEALSQMDHVLRSGLAPGSLFAGKTTVSVSHDG